MANTTKTQPNRMENIKTVKTTVSSARELLQTVAKLKQQSTALTDSIRARKTQLVAEEANKATQAQVVESPKQEPVVVEQPKVEPVVEKPVEVAQPAPQKPADKPKQKPAQPAQKPAQPAPAQAPAQPKVSSVVENGREVKTYTDDKGNVKVRKFLDTSAQQRKPAPRQDDRRGPQQGQGQGRPQGGPRPNGRPNATPVDKGDKQVDKRQQGGKPQQNKKPAFVAPVVDLPRPEPQKSYGNKNKTKEHPEEKRVQSKKALITRNYTGDYDEDRVVRKARPGKKGEQHTQPIVTQKITHAVITTQEVPIKVLSEKIGVSAS